MQSLLLPFYASLFGLFWVVTSTPTNINGSYQVKKGFHYSNKTTIEWGRNSEKEWSVFVTLPVEATTYDCTNTTDYSCEDASWFYDWNKLWGKTRCGYLTGNHEESDRFVWRRCSDASCAAYDGTPKIQIAGYSYDNSVAPYSGERPELLPVFKTTISPNVAYKLTMLMDEFGLTTFTISTADSVRLESVTVQHLNKCESNFYEGTVQGLYFGGTCAAPVTVVTIYQS